MVRNVRNALHTAEQRDARGGGVKNKQRRWQRHSALAQSDES